MKKFIVLLTVFLSIKAADISEQYKIIFKDGASGVYNKKVLQNFGTIKDVWNVSEEEAQVTQFSMIDKTTFDALFALAKKAQRKGEVDQAINAYNLEKTRDLLLAANFLDNASLIQPLISHFCKQLVSPESLQKFIHDKNFVANLALPSDLMSQILQNIQNAPEINSLLISIINPPVRKLDILPYANPWDIALSSDGAMLALQTSDNSISVIEVKTGKRINGLTGYHGSVHTIIFSTEGLLASADVDWSVKIWDPKTGNLIRNFDNLNAHSLDFSSHKNLIAIGLNDSRRVKIFDYLTGESIQDLGDRSQDGNFAEGLVSLVKFSLDGKSLISVYDSGQIDFWDIKTGVKLRDLLLTPRHDIGRAALSSDQEILASIHNVILTEGIAFYSLSTGKFIRKVFESWGHGYGVLSFAFLPQSRLVVTLLSNGRDCDLLIIDSMTGQAIKMLPESKDYYAKNVAVSSNGTLAVSYNGIKGNPTTSGVLVWDFNIQQLPLDVLLLLHLATNNSPEGLSIKKMISPNLIKQTLASISQPQVRRDLESYFTKALKPSFWQRFLEAFQKTSGPIEG